MNIAPQPAPEEWVPGREVWVKPETMAIQKLRDTYVKGEAAQVIEVRPPDEAASTEAEPLDDPGTGAARMVLLRVSSHQEETIVEAVPALAAQEVAAGDTVRIDRALGLALSLLQRGRQDVLLAEVPDVSYADVGGLDVEMAKIRDAIEEAYVYPAIFQRYILQRPRGVLLYGPPAAARR